VTAAVEAAAHKTAETKSHDRLDAFKTSPSGGKSLATGLRDDVSRLATQLNVSAQRVTQYASTQQLPVLTPDQYLYITNAARRPAGTVVTRLQRVEYLNAIRVLQRDRANEGSAPIEALRVIRCLMAHPKGVEMNSSTA
jgi:hypothetical protein